MLHAEYCEELRAQVGRFIGLLSVAAPATPVPTCPGWDLAALAGHVGATHRWVTAMVAAGATDKLAYRPFHDVIPAEVRALPDWLADGADKLASTLASTPPERPVWAWGPDPHARFWSRRMLHEVAVHHADAALALNTAAPIAPPIAADGVEEFLTNLPHAGWVPGAAAIRGAGQTMALAATDTGSVWLVTLAPTTLSWCRTDRTAEADVVVRAPVADLYLFLWGRIPARTVTGDADLLARWTAATAL